MSKVSIRAARATVVALSLCTSTKLALAQAPGLCVPPPAWIPNLSQASIGPVWLPPSSGSTAWRAQLDDPRWSGSPVSFFTVVQGGDITDGFYRAVATFPGMPSPSHIYVSLQVRTDPDGPDPRDAVYFGITQGIAGAGAYLVVVPPEPSSTAPVSGPVPHDPQFPRQNNRGVIALYQRTSVSPPVWVRQSAPSWLLNVATWLGSPGVSWAITMEIDTTQIPVGNGAQVFFGQAISVPADGGAGQSTVSLSTAPQAAPGAGIGGTTVLNDTSQWPQLPAQVGQTCGPGITIYNSSIGVVVNGALTAPDGGTNPIVTTPGSVSTFRAELHGVPATLSASPFSIRARFRVSDWASALGDPAAVWDSCGMTGDVFTADAGAFSNPPWRWSTPDGGIVDIDYTCSVSDGGNYCPSPSNGATQPRQIVLADIAMAQTAHGGSIQYAQAYRDVYYQPPPAAVAAGAGGSGPVTAVGGPTAVPPCNCDIVGADGWSVAALGAALGAGMLVARRLRRRARSSPTP